MIIICGMRWIRAWIPEDDISVFECARTGNFYITLQFECIGFPILCAKTGREETLEDVFVFHGRFTGSNFYALGLAGSSFWCFAKFYFN